MKNLFMCDDVKLFCSPEFVSSEKSTQWIRILWKASENVNLKQKKKRETQIHPTITLLYLFACVDGKFTTLLLLHICMTAEKHTSRSDLMSGGKEMELSRENLIWFFFFPLSALRFIKRCEKSEWGRDAGERVIFGGGKVKFSSNQRVEKHGKKKEKIKFFIICLVKLNIFLFIQQKKLIRTL